MHRFAALCLQDYGHGLLAIKTYIKTFCNGSGLVKLAAPATVALFNLLTVG